ncbi:hypothetical protein HPULCUR_007340 [Helicostylum pulchrum]|uniref:Uncharacterized protein n=1 Tax=Helicostylum pulchrum TaxID=562976 RepID=A0ABP9Y4H1_9FUNG
MPTIEQAADFVKNPALAWSGTPKPFNGNNAQKKLRIVFSNKKNPCLVEYAREPKSLAGNYLHSLLQKYPTETIKKDSALKDPVVVLGTDRDLKSKATTKSTAMSATGKFFLRTTLPKKFELELKSLFENISSRSSTTPVHHRKPDLLSKTTTEVALTHIENKFRIVGLEEGPAPGQNIANCEATVAANMLRDLLYRAGLRF